MVFRSINKTVFKKKGLIQKKEESQIRYDDLLEEFINREYGGDILSKIKYSVSYDVKDNSLVINTSSKIFANDLTLKAQSLVSLFTERGFKINRVVIR